MELFDYISIRNKKKVEGMTGDGRSLWGMTSGTSQADRIFMEYIWRRNGWANVIELGMWYGVTSLYLGMLARTRGGLFMTFDKDDARPQQVKDAWLPNMKFFQEEILAAENPKIRRAMVLPNTVVFMDNGDKEQEVRMYAKYLAPGNGLLVHNLGTEVDTEKIKDTLLVNKCTREYEAISRMTGSCCGFWRKAQI